MEGCCWLWSAGTDEENCKLKAGNRRRAPHSPNGGTAITCEENTS